MTNKRIPLTEAAALFEQPLVVAPTDVRRKLSPSERGKLRRARTKMVAPILVRDVNGVRAADAATLPAHLRRYYGVTTVSGQARKRPHRNVQGIKGGQRGNGAVYDGTFHGLTPIA